MFTPKREVDVTTGAALKTAVANLRAGDLVKATADFTLSSSSGNVLVINKQLATPGAVIDLSEHNVKIVYTGTSTSGVVGVWITNAKNVSVYGGDVSTDPTDGQIGGACILQFASTNFRWWGFRAHDCGSDGYSIFTGSDPTKYSYVGPVTDNDIEGDISRTGFNAVNTDPHQEKCTGTHGMNLADTNTYTVSGNRIALNVHDASCIGGGISFGSGLNTNIPDGNTIILECSNLTFVSTIQTGGNCYQTWGSGNRNTNIKYIEAADLTGHAYWAGGLYNKAGPGKAYLTTDTVDYGRASNIDQNPRYAEDATWDKTGGTVFKDVSPRP